MPQLILPLVPKGATQICDLVYVFRGEDRWTYFYGTQPIYTHKPKDNQTFRFVTSQLIDSGACRQAQIIKTFGVSKSSVIRSVKKLRDKGPKSFFEKRRVRRGGTVLNKDVLEKAQDLLGRGCSKKDAADELGIKYDTLRKAVCDGRLRDFKSNEITISKSSRNVVDAAAADGMGTACTRVVERVLASMGKCTGASVNFETCLDVPKGGVLCALPTLLTNGLLNGAEQMLGKVTGYYTIFHILLLLAFMALCRIKTVEKLRGYAPGEFGRLLGLDRIPEARCLRKKLDKMSTNEAAEHWAAHLSRHWLNAEYEAVGTLYIDGHVRVYHGHLTKLPRRYVSRQRLCLRGVTDYWVNDAIGCPFFVIEKVVDPGMLDTLKKDIVPRLLKDVPGQPTKEQFESEDKLDKAKLLCRFILVFDREGYSPEFFAEMWREHRIACISYHKYPGKEWPEERFNEHKVTTPRGEVTKMHLCEMGSLVGSKKPVWMREVRKLTESGHQTSIISTAFKLDATELAGRMFSRWCQENFFRYMMQHFDIDQINEHGAQSIPDTQRVVNPAWRELNRKKNSIVNKLRYRQSRFGSMTIHPETKDEPEKYEIWVDKKAKLFEEIQDYEHQRDKMKSELKNTDKHITLAELDEKDKFHGLRPGRRRLVETVRMIAYRAETAMVGMLISPTVDSTAARRLLQDLFISEADILPDIGNNQLRIRVHNASRPAANRALGKLFSCLNDAEIKYPGTDIRLVYELQGDTGQSRGQGVTLTSQR